MQKSKPENVTIEISPATRANPPDPIALVKALVEQHFAELLVRRDDFMFRPFFDEKRVSQEIRRLQTVPESLAWGRVFEQHGCLHCHRVNLVHGGCGFCSDCYHKIAAWKKKAIRWNALCDGTAGDEYIRSAFDSEKLARLAMTGRLDEIKLPAAIETKQEPANAEISVVEPQRHSSWCIICRHPNRAAIERDFIEGGRYGSVREICRKYRLKGTCGIYRHARALGLNAKRALRVPSSPTNS